MRIILIFILIQFTLSADSFFVKYNPSVTGNGTAASPWGTLENIDWKNIPDSSSIHLQGTFRQAKSGSTLLKIPNKSGKVIVFKAWDENTKPVFDGNGSKPSDYGIEVRKGDYLTFEDITFKNFSRNPVFVQGTNGQRITGVTIRHCTFDPLKIAGNTPGGITYAAVFMKFTENSNIDTCTINYVYESPVAAQTDGVYSQDNINNSYVGNTIHIKNSIDDQKYHIDGIQSYNDEGLKITKNSVVNESSTFGTHQNRQGVYINTVKDLEVSNNNIVLEDGSSSIGVHPDKCFISVKIFNNTLVNKYDSGQQLYIEFPKMDECNDPKSFKVYNNIFYKRGTGGGDNNPVAIKLQDVDKTLMTFDNNLYYNTNSPEEVRFEEYDKATRNYHSFSSWKESGRDGKGDVGDPQFAPSENFIYMLSEVSEKAVDMGTPQMEILDDLNSVVRPQGKGFDIGAFEFTGKIKAIVKAGGSEETVGLGNFPNPFNPQTIINFNLTTDAHVKLFIYDILGQMVSQVIDNQLTAGKHSVSFNASGFASGVYVYTIEIEETGGNKIFSSKKMIVNK